MPDFLLTFIPIVLFVGVLYWFFIRKLRSPELKQRMERQDRHLERQEQHMQKVENLLERLVAAAERKDKDKPN